MFDFLFAILILENVYGFSWSLDFRKCLGFGLIILNLASVLDMAIVDCFLLLNAFAMIQKENAKPDVGWQSMAALAQSAFV